MSLNSILTKQIGAAFKNTLGKGELTEDITLRYITGEGSYDLEADEHVPETNDVDIEDVVIAKITYDDMQNHGALATDAKLLLPGAFITQVPEADTDRVIRSSGLEWFIRKSVEVPGGSLVILFIYRT